MWVRGVHQQLGRMEVDTAVEIAVPNSGGRRAEVTLEADPGRYAYGLPIFAALLVAAWGAARAPGRASRAALGYVLLLPAQAFSLVMYLLMQLAGAAQFDVRVLRVEQRQLECLRLPGGRAGTAHAGAGAGLALAGPSVFYRRDRAGLAAVPGRLAGPAAIGWLTVLRRPGVAPGSNTAKFFWS